MKKTTLAIALTSALGLSSSAFALDLNFEPYAGLQAGHLNSNLKIKDSSYKEDGLSVDGYTGGVFVGALVHIDDLTYGGIEASYQSFGPKYTESEPSIEKLEIEQKDGFSFAFIGGLKPVQDAKMYAKLGYKTSKIKVKDQDYLEPTTESNSETINGFQIGGGGMIDITEQIGIRLEWTQTYYSTKKDMKTTENLVQIGGVFSF